VSNSDDRAQTSFLPSSLRCDGRCDHAPNDTYKFSHVTVQKRVSVKKSNGVCDWGRTHIAIERKHKEWRDHRTNLVWHQLKGRPSPILGSARGVLSAPGTGEFRNRPLTYSYPLVSLFLAAMLIQIHSKLEWNQRNGHSVSRSLLPLTIFAHPSARGAF
jgi:hypothetical protein